MEFHNNLWISDAYPWQISLTYSGGSHICGGSIINEKQVICAAHCVEGMENLAVGIFENLDIIQ